MGIDNSLTLYEPEESKSADSKIKHLVNVSKTLNDGAQKLHLLWAGKGVKIKKCENATEVI